MEGIVVGFQHSSQKMIAEEYQQLGDGGGGEAGLCSISLSRPAAGLASEKQGRGRRKAIL